MEGSPTNAFPSCPIFFLSYKLYPPPPVGSLSNALAENRVMGGDSPISLFGICSVVSVSPFLNVCRAHRLQNAEESVLNTIIMRMDLVWMVDALLDPGGGVHIVHSDRLF